MLNWVPSLEQLAADPGYTEAPVVGIQTDDVNVLPESVTEPIVDKGFAVQPMYWEANPSTEDMSNTITNGIFEQGEDQVPKEGHIVSLVSKWPTDMPIPKGGAVIANGLDDDTVKGIKDEGYEVHTSSESYASTLPRIKLR